MISMLEHLNEKIQLIAIFFLKNNKESFSFSFLWKHMGHVFHKVSITLVLHKRMSIQQAFQESNSPQTCSGSSNLNGDYK